MQSKLDTANEVLLLKKLARNIGMDYVELEEMEISSDAIQVVGENIARKHLIVPISIIDDTLRVAMADPLDFQAIDDIKLTSGKRVVPVLASKQAIKAVLDKVYAHSEQAEQAIQEFNSDHVQNTTEMTSEVMRDIDNAPIVRIVNSIFIKAVNAGASDIHIEPFEKDVRVRMRTDGDLKELMVLPQNMLSGVVTRIKILADLNIAETKRPQDGRVKINVQERSINMRISTIPALYGEKIVIRLMNRDSGVLDKSEIGLSSYNLGQIDKLLKISEGIVLLTGPTGSGKTTTLYALLKEYNTVDRNIVTLEDPVEFQMHGVNQVQVNAEIGMTFASGLRSILRQDPDVIMLGEIRDEETAQNAIRAAITGHIVLSTLHTNDTVSSLSRLSDMGIPKYMVTSAVVGVVAQRLLKRICKRCSEDYVIEAQVQAQLGLSQSQLKRGRGCSFCNHTGYKGRIAIHEILVMTEEIKRLVNSNTPLAEIKDCACRNGMKTLNESAMQLVENGVTTLEEMLKATYKLE